MNFGTGLDVVHMALHTDTYKDTGIRTVQAVQQLADMTTNVSPLFFLFKSRTHYT